MNKTQLKTFINYLEKGDFFYTFKHIENINENRPLFSLAVLSGNFLYFIIEVSTERGTFHNCHPINGYISADRMEAIESALAEAYAEATKEA